MGESRPDSRTQVEIEVVVVVVVVMVVVVVVVVVVLKKDGQQRMNRVSRTLYVRASAVGKRVGIGV